MVPLQRLHKTPQSESGLLKVSARTRPIETLATHFETSRERVTERFLTSDIGSSPFSVFRIARPCSSDGGIEVSVP